QQIGKYQSKENIYFLGRRTDVPQLLKISDLFVLPTLFEGMSNALMEAMAIGLPIITTDISENRTLIENKKTGLLVPVKNSSTITQAIKQIKENPLLLEQLPKEAKATIKNSFSLEKIATRWEDILTDTLK
ncbi:MAG: glycosyltransferase, partial [Candidatus Moranbacteria bacterium]|nr:glycosyltransferase [Candidatus Moranbacteria bacterium]